MPAFLIKSTKFFIEYLFALSRTHLLKHIALSIAALLLSAFFGMSVAQAEQWLFDDQYLLGGLGYEDKMPNTDKYKGTKLIAQGRYILNRKEEPVDEIRQCCQIPSLPTEYRGVLDAALRYGFESNELEYLALGVSPWARMWDPAVESDKTWQARRDLLEIGSTRYVSDDALELDSYLEVSLFRAGRVGEYKRSPESAWAFALGAQASFGYAWAESANKTYSKVDNPYAGIYLDAAANHDRFGSIYFIARFVNGFSLSNPSRGNPTAREARVRNGYAKKIRESFGVDIYWEKRSFYFDEGGLANLYTWVRTYGAELSWYF